MGLRLTTPARGVARSPGRASQASLDEVAGEVCGALLWGAVLSLCVVVRVWWPLPAASVSLPVTKMLVAQHGSGGRLLLGGGRGSLCDPDTVPCLGAKTAHICLSL